MNQNQVLRTIFSLFSLILLGSVIQCSSPEKPKLPAGGWQNHMHALAQSLTDLYPLIVDEKAFNDPENYYKIEEDSKKLLKLAYNLDKNKKKASMIDSDPSLGFIAKSFAREMSTAVEGLSVGKRSYARYVLKNTTSYCIQCHTRGQWGPEFNYLSQDARIKDLPTVRKAELLMATRNYDKALELYRSVISNTKVRDLQPASWDEAAKNALNITVRVKQDPKLSTEIINEILEKGRKTSSLRSAAKSWKRSVAQWKGESSRGKIKNSMKVVRAKTLIEQAKSGSQSRKGLIEYFRASALLHEFLRSKPEPKKEAEAFFLLGQSYEATRSSKFSNLNEFYYKACIHRLPHSELAMKCFGGYEGSLSSGFSGSSGLSIPPSAFRYMGDLKELASPLK